MSDIAIRVEGLSKQYRIGGKQERYRTLRDTLTDAVAAPFRRAGRLLRGEATGAAGLDQTIWALKDVSFEVKRGEVVGIIGANGAGKSTLLKILSRITEPTEGYADVFGRVGALLEVGTGFHPELTGRENIYLNGAILGMTREEIDRKFDEIVDFAGVEKFIDTPVKHYSSGMGLRLGFAVAAHLDPEILVVDEVLAVGDAAFQKKCLGKMSSVADGGRTVLFVSHNMAAVQNLCGRAIYLREGSLVADDTPDVVIAEYLASRSKAAGRYIAPAQPPDRDAYFTRAELITTNGEGSSAIPMGGNFTLELEFKTRREISTPVFSVRLSTILGENVVAWRTQETYGEAPATLNGGVVRLYVKSANLLPGHYTLSLGLTNGYTTFEVLEKVLELEVVPRQIYLGGKGPSSKRGEKIFTPCSWTFLYD